PATGESAARRKVFVCSPSAERGEGVPAKRDRGAGAPGVNDEACAKKILTTLATRAYRRPLTDSDVQILLDFYRAGRDSELGVTGAPSERPRVNRAASNEDDFDLGIQRGIERILAAPSFLFRIQREPAGVAAGAAYHLSDLDLASRLSFFLWSSVP